MAKRMGETSYKETALGILPRSKLIQLEAEGIVKVWRYVLRATRPGTRITPRYLQKLHKIGFGWIFPDLGGCFRRVDVEVSNHKPPAFYLVPQLPIELKVETKRGRDKYIRALRAADAGDPRGLKRLVREATEEAASKIHEI